METQDQAKLLRHARELIAQALAGSELPQIEAILRNADMELHWALWNLGEPVALRPELEYRTTR
ncbi:MAG: hypothetical protein FJY26_10575 [Betaproteobacteria bacterium]|nr:hypothetical protein [Betaproteobacteria bacterium]